MCILEEASFVHLSCPSPHCFAIMQICYVSSTELFFSQRLSSETLFHLSIFMKMLLNSRKGKKDQLFLSGSVYYSVQHRETIMEQSKKVLRCILYSVGNTFTHSPVYYHSKFFTSEILCCSFLIQIWNQHQITSYFLFRWGQQITCWKTSWRIQNTVQKGWATRLVE